MLYWFDTEFIEDGSTIDLLSIGMVAEDGRELYQCNQDAKLDRAGEWVIWNVYPHLPVKHSDRWYWRTRKIDVDNRSDPKSLVIPRSEIRDRIRAFVGDDLSPSFWAYYAGYDWVALCQLFGRMIDLPQNWPKYCLDVKQLAHSLGVHELPPPVVAEHHALSDARWTRQSWIFLQSLKSGG